MILQQFQFYALNWPIVSEHLSFTVNIAVSGLCNFTYFCLFVLHCIRCYFCIRFCQQPLCLFQFCHWAELSFINTRGVRNSRLGAVRYGAYKCSPSVPVYLRHASRCSRFNHAAIFPFPHGLRTDRERSTHRQFFGLDPKKDYSLSPKSLATILLLFSAVLVGLQSNSWLDATFKNIVVLYIVYCETLHAE